jgi:hypothetical protein
MMQTDSQNSGQTPSKTADTTTGRTLGRTLWSLFLAMLNATLILVALCLWLGWHVLSETRAIADRLADSLTLLTPIKGEIAGLRSDLSGLRGDLAGLQGQAAGSAALTALGSRLAAMDSRITETGNRIDAMTADPGTLIDRAVDRVALQIKSGIDACTAPGT